MKYVKTFENLKEDIITNEYKLWVSNDDKYAILKKTGYNYEAHGSDGKFSDEYHLVFPIEMVYDNMSKFNKLEPIDSAKDIDLILMIRKGNMNITPVIPIREGYEKLDLTIKDFRVVTYTISIGNTK